MKNVLQDAELKLLMEKAYIPQTDVRQNVMSVIEAGSKSSYVNRKRSLVLISLFIILLCCSAFTIGYRVWELQNTNGDVIMKVHESDLPKQVLVINQYDDLYNLLKPGESVFVYETKDNKPSVRTFCRPLTLTSANEARKHVPFDFKVPSVPDNYQLVSIDIQSLPLKEPDLEAFKKEAKSIGKTYFTKAISESESSKRLLLKYVMNEKEIMLSIFRAEGIDMYTDIANSKTIKNIKIGNHDALYYKDKKTLNITLREEIDGTEYTREFPKNVYKDLCKYYIQYDAFVSPITNGITDDDLIGLLKGLK